MKTFIFIVCLAIGSSAHSQLTWQKGGNAAPGGAAVLGTNSNWNSSLNIVTFGIQRAFFSTNQGLFGLTNTGDGLRVLNPNPLAQPGLGEIDIFTSIQNHTEIRFGGSGNIRGANNRFEMQANYRGLYFNTREGQGIYKFARLDQVTAIVGTNNYWRIGMQTDNFPAINGNRRLEVVDQSPQLRLHYGGVNSQNGPITDFLSNSQGNLQIMPAQGRVAINLNANPTANLDVNGDARIRNVQLAVPDALFVGVQAAGGGTNDLNVRRLDFSGNTADVLLGNGTWGPAPGGNYTASQGVSLNGGSDFQLGVAYGSAPGVPFLMDREIQSGGNDLIFSGSGNIAIGLNFPQIPTQRLDVQGNARFRNIPVAGGQSLILGLQSSPNPNDVRFSRLAFTGNTNDVLLGNGTWGTIPLTPAGGYALCTDPASITDLPSNGKMGLNNYNFYFEGQGVTNNKVGLGYPCSNFLIGKISVRETSGTGIGVFSEVSSPGGNVAGLFRVDSGTTNKAIQGNATGGNEAYGAQVTASGATTNYGVHASAPLGSTDYAGYFNGNVFVTGDLSTLQGSFIASDQQFKTNVTDLNGATTILNQLSPRNYFMDTVNFPGLNFESDLQMGLIAQEVELLIPTIVGERVRPAQYDSLGMEVLPELTYKDIEYTELIPLLIAGFQEQNQRVDSLIEINSSIEEYNDSLELVVIDLNERLSMLENCLANILPALCNANNLSIQQTPAETQEELRSIIDVELGKGTSIVLNQNVPNPFAERTVITYSIPTTVGKAQILFYNGSGELINCVDLIERGEGQLNVFANDLSSGVYTYSLVADGKLISTKRMVKQ